MNRIVNNGIVILSLFLFFNVGAIAQEQGIIINEFSNGASGTREYIEFLAVGCSGSSVDIRGWLFDDNNGDFSGGPITSAGIAAGHSRFSMDIQWASVPVGALILVYNSADKNPSITLPDDPSDANNDSVYVLSHANSTLIESCNSAPASGNASYASCTLYIAGGSWNTVGMRNQGDATQVRRPDGSYFHGFGFGDATSNNNGGPDNLFFPGLATASAYSYTSSSCNYRDITNFTKQNVPAGETPGLPNNASNLEYIEFLREGIISGSISADQTICEGVSPATLDEVSSVIRCYVSYQWQSSSSGIVGSFTDIIGEESISYSPPALTTNQYFRRIVKNICVSDTSNIVAITIIPSLTKPTTPAPNEESLCVNPVNSNFSTTAVTNATSYLWELYPSNAGSVIGSSTSISIDWNDTYTGIVKVTVKAVGCETGPPSDTIKITIIGPIASAGLNQLEICGNSTSLHASPGPGTWTILSGNGGNVSSENLYNSSFTGTGGESYLLEWTSSSICSFGSSSQVQIQFASTPLPPSVVDGEKCDSGSLTLLANGGVNGNYRWYDASGLPIANEFNNQFVTPVLNQTETYFVSLNNGICESAMTEVNAFIYEPAIAGAGANQNATGGQSIALMGEGNGSYLWSPSSSLSSDNIANPIASPSETTTYYLTVTTENGCVAMDSVTISIVCDQVVIPNLITPNEDGKNDEFNIGCTNSLGWYLEISNRWGDTVYKTNNYANEWNATGLSEGVYYYYLNSDFLKVTYKGWVQVLK